MQDLKSLQKITYSTISIRKYFNLEFYEVLNNFYHTQIKNIYIF